MVSWSKVESKHQGLAFVIIETLWIQLVLEELCIPQSAPPLVWCDNQSSAHFASNPVFHAWLKHIKLDLHFIRDKVLKKDMLIHYIPSFAQVVDILHQTFAKLLVLGAFARSFLLFQDL